MPMMMDIDSQDVDHQIGTILNPGQDKQAYIAALKELADRSRSDLTIRGRLAEDTVLQSLTRNLGSLPDREYDQDYEQETLRCLGNACALNPDAIRLVSALGFAWFERYTLPECPSKLQNLASAVLYNISAADFNVEGDEEDCENPALKACFAAGVHVFLIRLLVHPTLEAITIEDLIDMLFWIASSVPADQHKELPDESIGQLINGMSAYCTSLTPEALSTLTESSVALLRAPPVRAQVAIRTDAIGLLNLLEGVDNRIKQIKLEASADASGDLAILLPQLSNLTWLLSDVSTEPSFAATTRLDDLLVRRALKLLLQSVATEQLNIASCLVVGNALLNMPESNTSALVADTSIVATVARLLSRTEASPDLLHAGSGLLVVLCRPSNTREQIGATDNLVAVVTMLCSHKTPQIGQDGLRLLKALGRNCPRNQEKLAEVAQSVGKALNDQQNGDQDTTP